jgi:hypothetical protein
MPTFNLVISSASILFLLVSVAISVIYPDLPFTGDFAYALFLWFLAIGVVRWIERGILDILQEDWYVFRMTIRIFALIAFLVLLSLGIGHFCTALNIISHPSQLSG